jgi:glucose-1-phosphatase
MQSRRGEIRLVLFDIGGVLTELSGLTTLLSWLRPPMTSEEVAALWLRSATVRSFETGKINAEKFAEQMILELNLSVRGEEFLTELCARGQRMLPGSLDLVKRVPSSYTRATLCNTNALLWSCLMKEDGLLQAFDHHFASHLTGRIKPDEEAFQYALATLGFEAPEALFLDDSQVNVEAARRIGMKAFRVRGPIEAERALREANVVLA